MKKKHTGSPSRRLILKNNTFRVSLIENFNKNDKT